MVEMVIRREVGVYARSSQGCERAELCIRCYGGTELSCIMHARRFLPSSPASACIHP
jgi:hypothetical protein